MVTPGSASPAAVTVPAMLPVVVCASAAGANASNATTSNKTTDDGKYGHKSS